MSLYLKPMIALLSSVLLLSGCGDTSSTSSSTSSNTTTTDVPNTVAPVKQPPVITLSASSSVVENQVNALTVSATDADNNPLTFSLAGGADAALFTIDPSTGGLSFIQAPDYEAPLDEGKDNTYQVVIQVSNGSLSQTQAVSLVVTDQHDTPPTITFNPQVTLSENQSEIMTLTATSTGGLPLVFSIAGGADASRFVINPSTGALSFMSLPDYEYPFDQGADNTYDVIIRVSDGSFTQEQALQIVISDVYDVDNWPTPTPTPTPVSDTLQYYSDWPAIQSKIPVDPAIESQVASILAQMTLEEKVGQMIQPNLDQVTPAEAKEYKLGSLLNGGGSWPGNKKHATAAEWASTADTYWTALDEAYQGRGFKVPFMWATDAVHGHNNVFGATVFPHNIGLGAANDPDLIYRIGQATAKEVAATGLDWTFAPTVATPRDYRWGRVYEGYSEDPTIVYSYAGKMVDGLQGGSAGLKTDAHVISNVKHWVGDGGTLKGADRGSNTYSEEYLLNIHATGYFSGLKAGAQVVMSSFNSWENDANYDLTGVGAYNKKVHGSKYLITDVLKGRMGFDGLVVTDWNGQGEINGCSASNCPAAVNAGNDVFMVTANVDWKAFYNNVIAQVNNNTIPMTRIDDAVTRILRVKMRAGLWDKPMPSARSLAGDQEVLGSAEHRALAREAVRKSMVLLKNKDNVLPLNASQSVYLAGSAADNLQKQTGGWSLTWQGTDNTIADFPGATTIKTALQAHIGAANVITDINAVTADTVAVVAIGEDPYSEFIGDIKDHQTLGFARLKTTYAADLATIKDLKSRGMKVITIFLSGRPLYVNEEINNSDAFIAGWLPGTEAGGIIDVLYRVNNADFTGRLSYSWPNTQCSTTINRNPVAIPNYIAPDFEQDITGEHAPLFPYGYGLSYGSRNDTSLDLDNLVLDTRNYGCGQSAPDTGVATLPLEVFGKSSGGEFVMRVSGNSNGWVAIPVAGEGSTDQGDVSATRINYQGQYDAVNVKFDGDDLAQIYTQYADEQGQDKSSYLNAESTLQFDIRMRQLPTAAFKIAQHCVWPCVSELTITDHLPAVSDNWSTIKIPSQCFADNGMSYANLNTPFLFITNGQAEFDLGNIRIVPKSVDPATDALTCTELAGGSSGGGGSTIDIGDVTEDKNLAVGFRAYTVSELAITSVGVGYGPAGTNPGTTTLRTSSVAYEGDSSLLLSHDGTTWGGVFGNFDPVLNLSSSDNIVLAVSAVAELSYLEIKLEDTDTDNEPGLNLMSYPSTVSGSWKIYTVPLSDFAGVDLTQIKVLGFWHPKKADGSYLATDILIDDIHFTTTSGVAPTADVDIVKEAFRSSFISTLSVSRAGSAAGNSTVTISASSDAYEGSHALLFTHNGTANNNATDWWQYWGGTFGEFSPTMNLSGKTNIVFALSNVPAAAQYFGVKLESSTTGSDGELNILSYTPVTSNMWSIYTIPLADFVAKNPNVNMADVKAVGFWNPFSSAAGTGDSNGSYVASEILIDDIHFE